MTIAFNRTPTNIRVPFWYGEVNSGLSYFAGNSKLLLPGQITASATVPANVPVMVSRPSADMFGAGSMLDEMVRWARRNNLIGEIWALPLADTGTAATKTITVSGTVSPGTQIFYVNGERLQVPVIAGDTVNTIASAIAAAINAGYTSLDGRGQSFSMSATVNAAVVTATARNAGLLGNYNAIDVGLIGDEGPQPATLTIANGVAGTGTPLLTAGLAALGDTEFDFIAMPYWDVTSLNALRDFLSDNGGRWDPMNQLYGHAVTVGFDSLSNLAALGNTRNDPHMSVMGVANSPSPPWRWAAALGGKVQFHKNLGAPLSQAIEISRPLQTIILNGILPPKNRGDQWDRQERNTLYYDGISGYTVTPDGQVAIDRLISTYRVNAWAQPDTTWLDIEPLMQTVYAMRFFRQQITQKHPRDALADDNPRGLQGLTTPPDLEADLIHAYALLCDAGLMKNLALFATNVRVEKASDVDRVNGFLPLDVINQLRIFAANVETALDRASV